MNTETIVQKIAEAHGLRRRGKLYAGPCPECGGKRGSDKFNIRPDGGYKCYACGISGDIITWLRKRENMSCPDAHDHAGKECRKSTSCPARENCRHGDKTGTAPKAKKSPYRRHAKPYQPQQDTPLTVAPIDPEYPCSKWLAWAEPFVAKAHGRLLKNENHLAYLAARGIDRKAVERFFLGLIPHQYNVLKKSIGLPTEQDGKTKLWVPEGLLVPIYDDSGALHRMRVRRPLAAREKFLSALKYVWLKGSGNLPLVIMPEVTPRGAVIVEAELDGYAIAVAHTDVIVIAIGTLQGGVGPDLHGILQQMPVILVALDAEAKSKQGVDRWKNSFRHARYWPTPKAKDAGDYFRDGGDLHEWIESGLPPKSVSSSPPTSSAPLQDETFSPGRMLNGGEGKKDILADENKPEYIEVTLSNGKVIYLVESKDIVWERMSAEGKPVFTRYELEKLKAATAAMTKEKRIEAAMAAIEAKEVFGGYISRGECHEQ